ncbi:MAG: YhcN/YlaJ family sporulation lipoprotein, partial [Bacillus sp. (in: Bacteria)]|nr:YhcN/YlaJ family sporulation lipoprotein [Bacillus sp. (in: firmicutes)]
DLNGEVSPYVEDEIAGRVRSTDRNIRNVYVSSNPDFVDRMSEYGDKIRSGRPITGLYKEFNVMIQSVFPSPIR